MTKSCTKCECDDGLIPVEYPFLLGEMYDCPCPCHKEENVNDKTELDLEVMKRRVTKVWPFSNALVIEDGEKLIKEVERLREERDEDEQISNDTISKSAQQIFGLKKETATLRERIKGLEGVIERHDESPLDRSRERIRRKND